MNYLFVISILAVAASSIAANDTPEKGEKSVVSAAEAARVIALVESKTRLKATSVEPSPLRDFYTVTVEGNIYYVDRQGKWLFDGHLVDMNTRTSVTALKKAQIEATGQPLLDWRNLNLSDGIKVSRGTPAAGRVLVTFEDPNCSFCKRLQPELDKVQNVTVLTFPLSLLGPNSQAKNEAIWCSADRAKSWAAALSGSEVKAGGACDMSGLVRNGQLAADLKVRGTPTIFLSDGTRIPGFVDAGTLETRLAEQQRKQK